MLSAGMLNIFPVELEFIDFREFQQLLISEDAE